MARRERRGWRAYIPTLRGGVQIFVALVAIKILLGIVGSTIGAKVPTSISQYFPNI